MSKTDYRQTKRFYYIGLFILFGLVIAFCASLIDYRIGTVSIRAQVARQAKEVFENKINELESYKFGLANVVKALRDNVTLDRYIRNPNPENYQNAISLFNAVSTSNSNLMQLRYLDVNGMEKIRVDFGPGMKRPSIIAQGDLQDKRHRYYFAEASQIAPHSFWYSKLDLNVENKKIEVPHNPVLRVASPVYFDQKFQGIVIINIHAKGFLNKFRRNPLFDISLIDQEGYFMVANDDALSWSKYLDTGNTIQTVHPKNGQKILRVVKELELQPYGEFFAGGVRSFLEQDGAIVLMNTKADAIKDMENDRQQAALLIITIILVLSVPLALLISKGPADLHRKIADQNRTLTEYLELIDENVHTCTIDTEGVFKEVSTAFAQTIGFDKDEILGMKYDLLYCSTQSENSYQKVWKKVSGGQNWSGEVQHIKKDGESYWADTVIFPKKDYLQNLIGYSVIYHDITDKKYVEVMSITDELTGLHNRRFFNTIIEKELNRSQRDNRLLAFAMLDVDYFKQYNDHYGHQKGDQVLKAIGEVLQRELGRASDYCFRLGGEEFGILLSGVPQQEVQKFIESIREAIETIGIEHKWSDVADVVTVSIGLLSVTPGIGITVDRIYKLADETLYQAKHGGRNRVVQKKLEQQV
ncbi:MAG: sensor domain-containing diguanylate cyclase [Desulfobulbaceae bacterium]|nr:sensor domain-containing diguanylate cyclase [Desulfobulbaceae bacterium]